MEKLRVVQRALLHGLILWVAVDLNDAIGYWLEIQRNGHYLLNTDGSPVTLWQRFLNHNYYQTIWIYFLIVAFFVESGYHFVFRQRPLRQYLVFTFTGTAVIVLLYGGWYLYRTEPPRSFFFTGPFIAIAGYSLCYSFLRDYFRKRQEEKNREIQQAEAKIKALKAQVNPHFFFNTLNTIYGTALLENAPRTATCIDQLSRIMRYTITETGRDLTPLSEEISFIEDYLQLQKPRIPDLENIRIETDISIDDPSVKIAPLLLLPFIENSFKYGISTDHPCSIKIRLKVKNKALHFTTENTLFPGKNKPSGLGTGIQNALHRLELSYPGRHQLFYGPEGACFNVTLTINLD